MLRQRTVALSFSNELEAADFKFNPRRRQNEPHVDITDTNKQEASARYSCKTMLNDDQRHHLGPLFEFLIAYRSTGPAYVASLTSLVETNCKTYILDLALDAPERTLQRYP